MRAPVYRRRRSTPPEILDTMAQGAGPRTTRKRIRFRPPGLKPTTKVGTLGPYRGRLGLAWVIAPLVAGLVIVVAGYLAVFH
jgi:hypothetical protein